MMDASVFREPWPITPTELFLMMPLTSIQVAAAAVPTNTRVAAIAAATAVLT